MITRIKKISQIGVFKDFRTGGSVPFADGKSITILFGRNTKGKSTLSLLLKSLGENDPSIVQDRETIPRENSKPLEVELSYLTKSGREKNIKYANGAWNSTDLKDKIYVFDQDFVHRNVISGDSITRDNKERFTDFVLGTEGVVKSELIETKKKQHRSAVNTLDDFRPTFVKGAFDKREVSNFVNLKVEEDTPTLEKGKEAQEKRLRRLEKINDFKRLAIPEIAISSAETTVTDLIKTLTNLLEENYKGVSDEAWTVLQEHIKNNCGSSEGAVNWLKIGQEISSSNKCPFCSQNLSSAKELIDTYQKIFDDKFETYEQDLKSEINTFREQLQLESAKLLITPINKFLDEVSRFGPFVPELEAESEKIEDVIKALVLAEEEYKTSLALWINAAQEVLDEKEISIHKSVVDRTKSTELLTSAKLAATHQANIKKIAQDMITHIDNARKKVDKLSPEQLEAEKAKLKSSIAVIERKLARIRDDKECAVYTKKSENINKLKVEIDKLTDELEKEQSHYLDQYFGQLDKWFKKLGSDDGFEIKKDTNRKGDKKVYSLSLKFNGKPISADKISRVFSESDKRNLALSVFMSKVERLADKKGKIIVLDDPVVSFDDNRISLTCRELKKVSSDFAQIIITTHYKSLIKACVDCSMNAQFVEINSENKQSHLTALDPSSFVLSAHERDCDRICSFVDGEKDYGVLGILRPFMEQHLRVRFQQQILANNLSSLKLGELIDELNKQGLIDNLSATDLHNFRESLNPDHHKAVDDENIEETRLEARDLIELLYGKMGSK